MATAGTGDVLTGVAAALAAQGLALRDAARLAAWVHGRAGDAAAADLGEVSMTAGDLLARLHVAFRDAGC
jgi:NAD(P)H-hydrate epimerase